MITLQWTKTPAFARFAARVNIVLIIIIMINNKLINWCNRYICQIVWSLAVSADVSDVENLISVLFFQEICDFCIVNVEIASWELLFWVSLTGSIVYIQKWIWLASWDQILLHSKRGRLGMEQYCAGRQQNFKSLLSAEGLCLSCHLTILQTLGSELWKQLFVQPWKIQQHCWWRGSVLALHCSVFSVCCRRKLFVF